MSSEKSYRTHFDAHQASAYADTYDSKSYSAVLWRVEQLQLAKLLNEFRESHDRIDYLDFACGTGRVLAYLEDKVTSSRGIEISEDMAQHARQRVTRSEILCVDITMPNTTIEGRYDLITAFRFVLNAEPELRIHALRSLAARLKGESSWLVFNNHGNLWSHKLALWPYHRVKRMGARPQRSGNYLSDREVVRIAKAAGLEIVRVHGCGLLSAKALHWMSFDELVLYESKQSQSPLWSEFGVNRMYVARRAR